MDGDSASTPIRSRYAQQVSADLEKNREAQRELGEQIAGLQQRLEQLRADEKWLSGIQDSLPDGTQDTASGSVAEEAVEEAAVPQPRREQPQSSAPARKKAAQPRGKGGKKTAQAKPAAKAPVKAAEKKAPARKTTAEKATADKTAAGKAVANKTAAKKTAAKAAGEPALGDLLKDILDRHAGRPRTAGEVRDELEERHPDRARDVNVVRNTLERLVAKSVIERARQKRTVLYTSADGNEPAARETEAQAPAVGADDTAADKAAASA